MRGLTLVFLSTFAFQASAYFQMDLLKAKRSGNKESVQWTLADWITQKNRMALADQWLALHRSGDLFELNASANHNRFKLKTTDASGTASVNRDSQNYELDAYISIFNLHGEYQKTSDNLEQHGGAAGLRLLGASSQTTSLTARYGWQRRQNLTSLERWDHQYAEGLLQLYIVQQFGLTGRYRYYFPADSNQGTRLEGHKITAGAFIEIEIFRIYGNYFQEPLRLSASGQVTQETRDGYEAGLKLFF